MEILDITKATYLPDSNKGFNIAMIRLGCWCSHVGAHKFRYTMVSSYVSHSLFFAH